MPVADFSKLRKLLKIQAVIQVFLVIILVFVALGFQKKLMIEGHPQQFLKSILFALALQLVVFFPIRKFAIRGVKREIEAAGPMTEARQQEVRRERIFDDFIKSAIFIFFATFIWRAPSHSAILATIYYSMIFTVISFLQCFNFAAKKMMNG